MQRDGGIPAPVMELNSSGRFEKTAVELVWVHLTFIYLFILFSVGPRLGDFVKTVFKDALYEPSVQVWCSVKAAVAAEGS